MELERVFFIECIQRLRKEKGYTYKEIAEEISDKHTISKLFHGHIYNEQLIHKILSKFDMKYDHNADFIQCEILSSKLLMHLEINEINIVKETILNFQSYASKYTHHLYFEELKYYLSFLSKHYLHNKEIHFSEVDLSTLFYYPKAFQIAILHAIYENLLFHAKINELIKLHTQYSSEKHNNVLLAYFDMLVLQANKKSIDANTIYRNYIYHCIENIDFYNTIRFALLHIQKDIRKHADACIQKLQTIETRIQKRHLPSKYHAFIPYIYTILYIRNNKHEQAYAYTKIGIQQFPDANDIFIPYYILLSIYLDKEIDDIHSLNTNMFHSKCIELYALYKEDKKKMTQLLIRYFPKVVCENPCYETLIHILNKIVIKTAQETHCYKSVMKFHSEYQKYNKNYYI